MSKYGLTRNQRECLIFIQDYMRENAIPPSYDEIRDGLGLKSKSGVARLIEALAERGHIIRTPNRARCIELVSDESLDADLPMETKRTIRTVASLLKVTPAALVEQAVASYLKVRAV